MNGASNGLLFKAAGRRQVNPLSAGLVLAIVALFSLAFLSGGAGDLRAAGPIGAVASVVTGQVTIFLPDGSQQPLKVGDRVEANYILESALGAKAVLTLDDGSRVEIFEATRIEINELLPAEKSKFSLSLFFGRVAAKFKKLRGDDVVITPTMVAGVRGTAFSVSVADDGASVVSVDEGAVKVATDKDGKVTSEVEVGPGNEVQANQAGVVLKPRAVTLATLKDFTAFRQKRLQAIQADLPQIISKLEKGIDPGLATLDRMKAMPLDRAKVLQELDKKAKDLTAKEAGQLAKLAIRAHLEAGNVLKLVRDFRRERMRLKSTFVQSQRLQSMLPNFADQLGPEYASVDAGLARILGRQKDVEQKERMIARQFSDAIAPIQPLLDKFKVPESQGSDASPAKPLLDMFKKKLE